MTGYLNERGKTPGRFFWRLCLQTAGAVGVFFVVVSLCQSTVPQADQWRQTIIQCFTADTDFTSVAALLSGNDYYDTEDAIAVQARVSQAGIDKYETMTIPVSGTVIVPYGQEGGMIVATDAAEPVLAAYDGTVTDIFYDEEMAYTITISHPNGFVTTYGGCTDCYVGLQEPIKKGQPIGCTTGAAADAMTRQETIVSKAAAGNFYFTAAYLGEPVDPLNLL